MKGLMRYCVNWGNSGCSNKVSQFARWSEACWDKEIALLPCGNEWIEYDEICRDCNLRQFELIDNRCILCESENKQFLGSGRNRKNLNSEDVFYYVCNNCNSILESNLKF
jgi:hypothetical protein